MGDNYFVKIEDKKMPIDKSKRITNTMGFTNLFFLIGVIVTSVMWAMLIFIGR